ILNQVTRDEANEALYFREQLLGLTFNWGEVMGESVCNIIKSWRFDRSSMGGKPKASALAPHADYIKALIDDHDLMEKRLKSSPRIMQLSSLDPFFNETSIDWKLLEESAEFVSNKDKNGVFRALHAMCCRKGDSPVWTEDVKIKGDLKNGYMVIHNILAESLEHIAYDVNHEDIDIDTSGDYSIPKKYVPMSQTLGWLYHQINMRTKSEEGRKDRVSSAGLGSLQRQFFLVLTGVMLVYESNLYNKEAEKIQRSGKKGVSQAEILELKSIHKDQTCLRQLVNTKHRNVSKRLKGTITPKEPTSTLAKTKEQERKIQNQVNSDLSRIRGDSIQAMALFFLYGTASFFHVWPTSREITQHDAAILINLSSLLANRRWQAVKDKPHVFGDRAWNRLDALMHQALSKFLNHNGDFRTDINWPSATSFFSSKFDTVHLAHVFTLDVLMETHFPGLSRSIDGSVAPHVNLEDKEKWDIDGPATESFKALMAVNESGGGHQDETSSESENEADEDSPEDEEEEDDEEDTSETFQCYLSGLDNTNFAIQDCSSVTSFRECFTSLSSHCHGPFTRVTPNLCNQQDQVTIIDKVSISFKTSHNTVALLYLSVSFSGIKPCNLYATRVFRCRTCKEGFKTRHIANEHTRSMHQQKVTLKMGNGKPDITIERGPDDFFHCPIGNCDYKQQNSRFTHKHILICEGVGRNPKLIVAPYSGTATVVPVDNEIELHDRLAKYNLMWNVRCNILICKICHGGVPVSEVRSHFNAENDYCPWTKEMVLEDLEEYSAKEKGVNVPPEDVVGGKYEPVQGLLIYNGFTCTLCDKSWPSKKTLTNHFLAEHGAAQPNLVREETPTPTNHSHREAVQKMIEKLEKHAAEESSTPLDDGMRKDMANWIFTTGIYDYVEGLIEAGKTYEELVVVGEEESINVMVVYIASWINAVMKRMHKTGQFLKRLCMAETSEMEDNKGMMPLQEKASVFKYAKILSTFIWFLVKQAESRVDQDMQLHNCTKAKIVALRDIVLRMDTPGSTVHGETMEYCDITNDLISKYVSQILCGIFQVQVGGYVGQYHFPPMQFLALSMVNADGTYRDPNLLTHLIAAIQYCTRLAFAEEYLDQPREPFNPDCDPKAPIADDRSSFNYLRKNGPGPFTFVRQLMHHVSTVILSEALPDMTFWVDQAHETLEVDKKRVTMSGIRNCIHIQEKLAQGDLSKLIQGCNMPAFDLDLYKDDASCREPFTNFLDHSAMEYKKYGLHVLKEVVSRKDVHGLLKSTWKGGSGEDVPIHDKKIWDEAGMLRWLGMYDKLQERLYFLYHVAAGQPLRGAEEATTLATASPP
ncbi:hypothetical protein DFH28DRAFT_894850, partial [Melampsora americana]